VGQCCRFFNSSIGLKITMALTGMLLCGFLLIHMLGNLLILFSPEAYNLYSFNLTSNKIFLYTAEVGLLGLTLLHILVAIKLSIHNRRSRPERYQYKKNTSLSRRSWYSSNMIITGGIILYFIVTHLLEFRFGEEIMTEQKSVPMRDIAASVIGEFQDLEDVIFYIVAITLLMLHILHGLRSAFASLGLEYPRYEKSFHVLSRLFVFGVSAGFIVIPIWIYFVGV